MTTVLTRPRPTETAPVRVPTPRPRRPEIVVRTDDAPSASPPPPDIVDLWGMQSFPASDPPSNW